MTDLPNMKIKALVSFPANTLGGTGIEVDKTNGNYIIGLDYSEFPFSGTLPPNTSTLVWDHVANTYFLVPPTATGGITDAPSDNLLYGRKNRAWEVVSGGGSGGGGGGGEPYVILVTGQSNTVFCESDLSSGSLRTWTPPRNLSVWNNANWSAGDITSTTTGTAFIDQPLDRIPLASAYGAEVARRNPGRPVYIMTAGYGGLSITHWSDPATPAPNMYDVVDANITAALATLGKTTIDEFVWWQGESDVDTPSNYLVSFESLYTRLLSEAWFELAVPITIFGVASTALGGTANNNPFIDTQQVIVAKDPPNRRFVRTDWLPASYWDGFMHARANYGYTRLCETAMRVSFGYPAQPIRGKWLPIILAGGSTAGTVYVRQDGWWSRTGDIVTAGCEIQLSARPTTAGELLIAFLPFMAADATAQGGGALFYDAPLSTGLVVNSVLSPRVRVQSANDYVRLFKSINDGFGNYKIDPILQADLTGGTQIVFTLTYKAVPLAPG